MFIYNSLDEPRNIDWIITKLRERYPGKKSYKKPSYVERDILKHIPSLKRIENENETLYVRMGSKAMDPKHFYNTYRKYDNVSYYEIDE